MTQNINVQLNGEYHIQLQSYLSSFEPIRTYITKEGTHQEKNVTIFRIEKNEKVKFDEKNKKIKGTVRRIQTITTSKKITIEEQPIENLYSAEQINAIEIEFKKVEQLKEEVNKFTKQIDNEKKLLTNWKENAKEINAFVNQLKKQDDVEQIKQQWETFKKEYEDKHKK